MVAFRKLFPVLALFALFLGLSSTASAQLTCVANSGVPPIVRSEGLTELTGDVVIQCSTGTILPAPFLANFQIFLNTNITSRLAGGLSEALLMIDEPLVSRQVGTATPFCVSPDNASNSAGGPGSALAAPACNPATAGVNYQQGTYTVFRAIKSAQGENSVVWPGIPVIPPGTNETRTFRITNVRANAAQIGTSSTLIPNQVTMFISISASQSLALSGPQQTVAFVQQGLLFDVRNCANSGGVGTAGNFVQCVSQNRDLFNDPNRTGGSAAQFGLRFREGFQTAFKKRIETPAQDASLPGQVFNTESGFVRSADTVLNSTQPVGQATQGTRVAARFNNVPAGTRIFVGTTGAAIAGSSATVAAALVSTDLAGGGSSSGGVSLVSATAAITCVSGSSTVANAAEITITNGTGLAVWEITTSDPSLVETLFFPVAVAFAANVSNNLPGLGQSTVTGNFAPFYAASNVDAGRMSGSFPIPRFVDNPISSNDFRIDQCATNLLFPFVTNQAGFDTGLAISNTSRDPFTNPNDRLQAGRCTLNYYGNTTGGGAAPAAQTTNANVEPGTQVLAVLSTGGNLGIAGTPGFQGYIIAQCGFQYAHGFAFVTDGPIGQARVAEGYLALVLDAGIATRGSNSETLGH